MRVLEDSKFKPGRQLLRLDKLREIFSMYSCGGKGFFFFFFFWRKKRDLRVFEENVMEKRDLRVFEENVMGFKGYLMNIWWK